MEDYIVYSLSQNKKMAKKVADSLGATVGRISFTRFSDGEIMVKTLSNVKNKNVIIIESTFKHTQERLFELLLLLDSINRSGAKSIRLFIPYFGYSRQERVSWFNEPISCQVVSKMIETANYDYLFTFDLHHPVIKSFFKKGIIDISTSEVFASYYLNYFKSNCIDINDLVIVSPDHGSNDRADHLINLLGGKKVILDKVRPKPNFAEHLSIDKDEVKEKVCIIVDDIIDTGGTIASAAKLLHSSGAKKVLVCASHAVFSKNCVNKLIKANVEDIVVTNTIEQRKINNVNVVDISSLILNHLK